MYGLELEKLGGDFKSLYYTVKSGRSAAVFSLNTGAKAHVISELDGKVLLIAPDRLSAEEHTRHINAYLGEGQAVYLPPKDDVLLNRKASSSEQLSLRTKALLSIAEGRNKVTVIPAEGLLQYYPDAKAFRESVIRVKEGEILSPSEAVHKLISGGYVRVEDIGERGEFTQKGDVIEVWPLSGNAVRISFFDELVEEIRERDVEQGESGNRLTEAVLAPVSDFLIRDKAAVLKKLGAAALQGRADEIRKEVAFRLELNPCDPSLIWALPFAIGQMSSILEYFGDVTVVFDEVKILYDKLCLTETEHKSRVKSLTEAGESTSAHLQSLRGAERALSECRTKKMLAFMQLSSVNPIFAPQALFNIRCNPVTRYYLDYNGLFSDVRNYFLNGYKVIVCCKDKEHLVNIRHNFKDNEVPLSDGYDLTKPGVFLTQAQMLTGFNYYAPKIVVIGAEDLFGKSKKRVLYKQKRNFIMPKEGDYVVHEVHGIGIYQGVEKLRVQDADKDYLKILYRDGDVLYIPVDQMELLSVYSGGNAPKLNKLGGKDFSKTKEKVKKSVKKIAIDLLRLYNERENRKGYVYSEDTPFQKEFEDSFEFDETEDQLSAVRDIKEDMEKGRLMDRLICGDVGFGKTEVAFRAIFKTVMDDKQAAILAPTTILAKQHYNTFMARVKDWGIPCALLTRLQTGEQTKKILSGLESGQISVVIGTHRLLSSDVRFRDLGLLVLDEEQRFGVEHKEKLKLIKKDVNILTLSATPIPRTLSMALNGIRDISLLETPPVNRLPVQTYVTEYSEGLIKDAVTRELERGGQVLLLYNKVESIDSFAASVQRLIGDAGRVTVAHGQMSGNLLDERITGFYQKEADVLVASTIIENGIDLPDANTLIVIEADKFGLAQLYQLRGRVGRSGMLAHAYFTVSAGKVISDEGMKRLTALMNYTELGSGFKIAMRDLEIRGAGNLLGAEQHGHIASVGYEMYMKLLREAVDEIKNVRTPSGREIEMKIACDACVDNSYVSGTDKYRIYRKISEVKSKADRDELIAELTDTYGAPARGLKNLINVSLLKNLVAGFEAVSVIINARGAAVRFADADAFRDEALITEVNRNRKSVVLTVSPVQLLFDSKNLNAEGAMELIIDFFSSAAGIKEGKMGK